MPVRMMREAGFTPPKQYRVGKWLIQPFYRRPSAKLRKLIRDSQSVNLYWYGLDAHTDNIGIDHLGRMVLFDY